MTSPRFSCADWFFIVCLNYIIDEALVLWKLVIKGTAFIGFPLDLSLSSSSLGIVFLPNVITGYDDRSNLRSLFCYTPHVFSQLIFVCYFDFSFLLIVPSKAGGETFFILLGLRFRLFSLLIDAFTCVLFKILFQGSGLGSLLKPIYAHG